MPSSDSPVLLITGASSGIGAATARAAAADGWRVVLAARSQDKIDDLPPSWATTPPWPCAAT
ncbi:MAG TPA: SDR family NAD(P)-dependent oxidoreductase [Thermoleophilaceae bacterium]|nr:SDR family NAD(P)-dependent oxidoreductase [Thermoleophilaceae bacterium]